MNQKPCQLQQACVHRLVCMVEEGEVQTENSQEPLCIQKTLFSAVKIKHSAYFQDHTGSSCLVWARA